MEEAALDFARQHPDVVLYISPRFGRAPLLVAEYRECVGGQGWVWEDQDGDRALPTLPWICTASAQLQMVLGPAALRDRGTAAAPTMGRGGQWVGGAPV